MLTSSELISKRRERVIASYIEANNINYENYHTSGGTKGTSEYIYSNQKEDAHKIIEIFYTTDCRAISIQKKTKVGADGLMIEIAKLATTHIDDDFIVNPDNVRILTGMSNVMWEKDMIDKTPYCFKYKIFHHGKLPKSDLKNLKNALIIIDEVDVGDKEFQSLQRTLEGAGLLDVIHMKENNNRFVFISATLTKQIYELYRWGDLHQKYKMSIPASYFGHKDFLEKDLIKEFYSLSSKEKAEQWIQEDILDNYGTDYRVHLVRVTAKIAETVQKACVRKGVSFRINTSADRLSDDDIEELFVTPLRRHIVLAVKGFFRRANLIPNNWKLRIGATHELYTKIVDNNVQIQGFPGRMTGYWRNYIEEGHKTGPHRTSIKAIEEYNKIYLDPFGINSYQTAGFKKDIKGNISANPTMLSAKNIKNLVAVDLPVPEKEVVDIKSYRIYSDREIAKNVCSKLYEKFTPLKMNEDGFAITSHHGISKVMSLVEAVKLVPKCYGLEDEKRGRRLYLPCYEDTADNTSIRFVIIIHPGTDESKIEECDSKFTSLILPSDAE